MKRKVYKNIDETVYTVTLKNKMKVYLLYKPGFVEKHAYVITKFGHFDSVRKINVNGKKISFRTVFPNERNLTIIGDVSRNKLANTKGTFPQRLSFIIK